MNDMIWVLFARVMVYDMVNISVDNRLGLWVKASRLQIGPQLKGHCSSPGRGRWWPGPGRQWQRWWEVADWATIIKNIPSLYHLKPSQLPPVAGISISGNIGSGDEYLCVFHIAWFFHTPSSTWHHVGHTHGMWSPYICMVLYSFQSTSTHLARRSHWREPPWRFV